MKKVFTALVLIFLALGLIGCGDGSGNNDNADDQETTSGSGSVSAEKASGSSLGEGFIDFITKKKGTEYVVEYKMSSDQEGMESYVMKQYVSGTDMRTDMVTDDGEVRTFMVDKTFTTCSEQQGDWSCMKIDMPQDNSVNEVIGSIEADPDDYDISPAGTKKVAGVTALCFKIGFMEQGTGGSVTECFSKEGVPLYISVVAEGMQTEMIATSYEDRVPSGSFKPPAEAQDMNAMMQQAMANMPQGYEMPNMG